jgi:hypothetical protein
MTTALADARRPERLTGRNGIIGALTEDLIDTSVESEAAIAALKHTPGAMRITRAAPASST